MGTETVLVETPELSGAVQSGKVTGVFTSPAQSVDTRIWEKLPWFYPLNAWLPRNLVMVKKKILDELKPNERDAVIRAASANSKHSWSAYMAGWWLENCMSSGGKWRQICKATALSERRWALAGLKHRRRGKAEEFGQQHSRELALRVVVVEHCVVKSLAGKRDLVFGGRQLFA